MIQREQIQAFVDDVVRHFHPERIVLFGSYAYGTATADSVKDAPVNAIWEKLTVDVLVA